MIKKLWRKLQEAREKRFRLKYLIALRKVRKERKELKEKMQRFRPLRPFILYFSLSDYSIHLEFEPKSPSEIVSNYFKEKGISIKGE